MPSFDPKTFAFLRQRMGSGGGGFATPSVSSPGVINLNIDLSALKDLWGQRKITDPDDTADPKPISVNMPRISPS